MLHLVAESCPALCKPIDYRLPGCSVHGDSPGKNTGVGCHASSRRSSQPRDQTPVSRFLVPSIYRKHPFTGIPPSTPARRQLQWPACHSLTPQFFTRLLMLFPCLEGFLLSLAVCITHLPQISVHNHCLCRAPLIKLSPQ